MCEKSLLSGTLVLNSRQGPERGDVNWVFEIFRFELFLVKNDSRRPEPAASIADNEG
jgi:hypothetical protein